MGQLRAGPVPRRVLPGGIHATMAQTLYDKIWAAHVVCTESDVDLIHIDRHLVHEVRQMRLVFGEHVLFEVK